MLQKCLLYQEIYAIMLKTKTIYRIKKDKVIESEKRKMKKMEKVKIAFIDDSPQMIKMYEDFFSSDPAFELSGSAADGLRGIGLIEEQEPDIALLDIVMPELDGFGVLDRIKLVKHRPKIIVVSALAQENFIARALRCGADYYMIKPFDFSALKTRVFETVSAVPETPRRGMDNIVADYRMAEPVTKFSKNKSLEEKISNIFITVGIPAHIKGYQFLREAIKMAIDNPEIINCITKKLYPSIAEKFETSPSKVERAIRHAIEVAWNRGKIENINSLFGVRVYTNNEKPTNGEFIALVADKMLIEGA